MPSFLCQPLGVGDGVTSAFQLCKYYGGGSEAQQRLITRPVAGSISVGVDGVAGRGWSHLGKGVIAFDEASAEGTVLTARSEEHTSELQSLMRISYAGLCLKTKEYKEV